MAAYKILYAAKCTNKNVVLAEYNFKNTLTAGTKILEMERKYPGINKGARRYLLTQIQLTL